MPMTLTSKENLKEELINAFTSKEIVFFKKDDIIYSEKNEAKGIYFIKEGRVKVTKRMSAGEAKIIRLINRGSFLGMHSVINGNYYTNTAIALEDTEAFFVRREQFLDKINHDINLKLLVMKLLCEKIDDVENQISSLSEKSASGRLAETLILLDDTYGCNEDNFLNIRLSSADLAQLTGASKGYLVKIISQFNNNKWIQTTGNKIKILDKSRLYEVVRS